ncbi:MAG: major capsid protein [Anaerolineae bacterium]|nr:major capsid protein [Anaerolineae bacterium]
MEMKMLKGLKKLTLAGVSLLAAGSAMAVPVDLTELTTAVDFSTATAAILVVAGALIVVYIAIKAAKFVIGMVRGA